MKLDMIIAKAKVILLFFGAWPVLVILVILSVISVAIIMERAYMFFTIRDRFDLLAQDFDRLLRRHEYAEAKKRLTQSPSAEAAVLLAGMNEVSRGPRAAEETMQGASILQRLRLEQGLVFLGTVGNNAPFVGLFGTVIGVLKAFEGFGQQTKETAAANLAPNSLIMGAIAEALVATAVGLFVAIPAVAFFNVFQRQIKSKMANADALSRVLIAHLEGEDHEHLVGTTVIDADDTQNEPAKSANAGAKKASKSKESTPSRDEEKP
jgi:biopolymer transport protein ExbB